MPNDGTATVLLALAFSNALLHALIPSHWLSFALVGRAHRWPIRTTVGVAALAGAGHVGVTVVLGMAVVFLGKELALRIPPFAEHAAAAAALILLGVVFLVRARGHAGCQHHGHHQEGQVVGGPDAGSVVALVLGMTLSPCLDLLSVYIAAATFSWRMVAEVSAIMAATTLALMVTLVWLALHGMRRLRLDWLERNEGYVVGALLILLGLFVLALR
ncbi:MAG TPA: hypothetical protein VKT77_21495 [Chthonomonadaceae bacterium]|nr:hypothetical protein [Chthonomonadaceae bacterium]